MAELDKSIKDKKNIMQESIEKMSNELQTVNLGLTNVETAVNSSASIPSSNTSAPPLQQSNQVTGQETQPGWISKPFKLDVPRFDGTDPLDWTIKVNQCFQFHQKPDNQRSTIASFHIEGPALPWFQWMQNNNFITSWQNLLHYLQARFGYSQFDNPQVDSDSDTNKDCDRL